uniref:ATP-binding protein n=1 Tax=unclassified Sphingopyxis TaxID=2614943 RepID=UPI0024AC928C
MGKRSITDREIGLIKAMLARGMANNSIQFYFNRQDRPVNSGRITGIRQRKYGPEVAKADDAALTEFLANFTSAEPTATVVEIEGAATAPALPMDETILRSLFRRKAGGRWFLIKGESDEFECKENFNIRNFSKPLKTIAGFANNRGGYLLFGIKDLPHSFEVCGLADDRFVETDQNKFSQTIRSALAPTPRFEVATIQLDGLKVGIIHVEPHNSKPVIACKNEGDVVEGAIYYRYSGETKTISYADLRAILDERDLHSREAILPMVRRLLELGPSNALVANLADGQLEGGKRPILIDPASLEQIKFIKEGAFDEIDGAPTLKVIGDAKVVPEGSVLPVRTVREEITVEAILRNFISRNAVEQPFAYFRQISHEAGWISPVFYYLHLAGKTRKEAAGALRASKNAKPKCREELIKLLAGKRSLYSKLGGNRSNTFGRIVTTPNLEVIDSRQAKAICLALTGMTEADAGCFDQFHSLLSQCLRLWENSDGDREL